MAAPIAAAAAKAVAKKVFVDILTEPEKLLKVILIVIGAILVLLLILALPALLLVSVPTLLMTQPNQAQNVTQQQLETIAIYQVAPISINKEAMEWVEKMKKENSSADIIETQIDFSLTWQKIMAIDTIRLNQDFKKSNKKDILDIGNKFLKKDVRRVVITETYEDSSGKKHTVDKVKVIISVTTKTIDEVGTELGYNDFQKGSAQNICNVISGVDIESKQNKYDLDMSDLKEYPPGNAKIPYFSQADARWATSSYGDGTIRSSGCGPTSLSMVVFGLTGRSDINPKSVADWAFANGYRSEGNGSYWSLMTEGGRHYGLNVEEVSRKNPKKIIEALSQGKPVISSMGPGHFTAGGHFIVLRGLSSDGKILVNDPASVQRSEQSWDVSIIMSESSTAGGDAGSPFWIFSQGGN